MNALQAFVTREYLAVVSEHGPGGVLSDYILEHSSDVAGMGLRENVARYAQTRAQAHGAHYWKSCDYNLNSASHCMVLSKDFKAHQGQRNAYGPI